MDAELIKKALNVFARVFENDSNLHAITFHTEKGSRFFQYHQIANAALNYINRLETNHVVTFKVDASMLPKISEAFKAAILALESCGERADHQYHDKDLVTEALVKLREAME